MVDLALKVVGVGSVGTLDLDRPDLGRDSADPLFFQIKEADASVLESFAGRSQHKSRSPGGRRSEADAGCQRHLPGLGPWRRHRERRDFYWRQLHDFKGSIPIEQRPALRASASTPALCGWTLARAHARSGDRMAIAAYLGKSDRFDQALAVVRAGRTPIKPNATTSASRPRSHWAPSKR